MKKMQVATLAGAVVLALGSIASAQAAGFSSDGWNASFDGELHGFYVSTHGDNITNALGVTTTKSYTDSRIESGFNPSKFGAHFAAPSYDGLQVTGNVQFASNIIAGNSQEAGGATSWGAGSIDTRVLDINVAGSFGTVSVGRSWAIYDGSAIVAEEGSGVGVGNLCFAASQPGSNVSGGTCGRIGTGYTWTNFGARIEYDTPDMGGFSARIGMFDGQSGLNATFYTPIFKNSPRFEAEGTFAGKFDGGSYKVWLGTLSQTLSANTNSANTASTKLSGTDFGARVDFGGLAVAGNVSNTKGFGISGKKYHGFVPTATGIDNLKATFEFIDVSYKVSNTRFGASWGTGKQDADAAALFGGDQLKVTHDMLYLHHNLTPQAVLAVEYDTVKAKDSTIGVDTAKYNLWSVGLSYYF
jgi:hypothetical protein